MKDWAGLATVVLQTLTAWLLYRKAVLESKKGTKRRKPRKRK